MSLLVIGSVAFDAIETPFGKTDKIIGGAATYIAYSASYFYKKSFAVFIFYNNLLLFYYYYFNKVSNY